MRLGGVELDRFASERSYVCDARVEPRAKPGGARRSFVLLDIEHTDRLIEARPELLGPARPHREAERACLREVAPIVERPNDPRSITRGRAGVPGPYWLDHRRSKPS